MKKVLVSLAFALAFYIFFQAAGLGRKRYAITDAAYAYGDFKRGEITFDAEPFGLVPRWYAFDNYEIAWETVLGSELSFVCFDASFFIVEAEKGGWLDCRIGRCGRVTVKQYLNLCCDE